MPVDKAKITIDKSFDNEFFTDKRGEASFFINKGELINITINKIGYREKSIKKVVDGLLDEPYKIYLDSAIFSTSPPIEDAFCNRKYYFYPIEGTYFKWKEKPFKTLGRAEFNWWGTTISLGSSLFFLTRQLSLKGKVNKSYDEGKKYPIESDQYLVNYEMNAKYYEKAKNNLIFLLPSAAIFITTKIIFQSKKKLCEQ